jgi:hypothetical protein
MQAQFADKLLKSCRTLGLESDMFQNGGVREHEKLSAFSITHEGGRPICDFEAQGEKAM